MHCSAMFHSNPRWHRVPTVLPLIGPQEIAQLGSRSYALTDLAVGNQGPRKQARAKLLRGMRPRAVISHLVARIYQIEKIDPI